MSLVYKNFFIGAGILVTLVGATFFFFSVYTTTPMPVASPPFDPGVLSWEQIATSSPWAPRDSAAVFVFNGMVWITGGLNGNDVPAGPDHAVEYWKAPHFNDMWSSEDGVAWTRVGDAAWPPRRSMTITSFNGALWMLGGWSPEGGYQSDVWRSGDAIHWTRVVARAPFPPREGQSVEVFNDRLYMMGGVNYDTRQTFNDVWYTEDGITWQEAPEAPWTSRWDHATAVYHGRLWLTGGMDLSTNALGDEWYTEDGMTWIKVTDRAVWPERQGHMLVPYRSSLLLLGRLNDDIGGGANDMWYSREGLTWMQGTLPPWGSREDGWVIPFKGRLYVLSGMDGDWHWTNDVWRSASLPSLMTPVSRGERTPLLSARASFMIDVGRQSLEMAAMNDDVPLPLASISKLMTALVALDLYTRADIEDELHRMLILSDNAAADSLAARVGTDVFVKKMNDKARSLGLTSMNFVNPSGLDPTSPEIRGNVGSARDVAALMSYIYEEKPELFEITGAQEYKGEPNTNELLVSGAPLRVLGGKTGETPRAGQNLVIIAESPSGSVIVASVLGSRDRKRDMWELLDYARSSFDW